MQWWSILNSLTLSNINWRYDNQTLVEVDHEDINQLGVNHM